jgi:hypothetical protein
LILVYVNREQQIANPERQDLVRLSVTPYLMSNAAGMTLNGFF